MTDTIRPTQALTANIETLMRLRNIDTHEDLADRMDQIGIGWDRRTVGRSLKGERRINADEIYGLALVLGTTVEQLMTPGLTERIDGKQQPLIWIKVGELEPVPYSVISSVVRDPNLDEHPNREPEIGIDFDIDEYWRIPASHANSLLQENLTKTLDDWGIEVPKNADLETVGAIYQDAVNERLGLS